MKKIITLLISVILVFSMSACNKEPSKPNIDEENPPIVDIETSTYLAQNGESEYKIIIPQDANNEVKFASEELQFFFKDATGITLPIVKDVDLHFNSNDKVLSVGNTTIAKESGITISYDELNSEGYKVKNYGNTVVMTGAKENGILYSVYGFLRKNFKYDFFAIDEWTINKSNTVKLMEIDITEIPTFNGRWVTCKTLGNDLWAVRSRMTGGQGVKLDNAVTPWSVLNDQSMMSQIFTYDKYKDRKTTKDTIDENGNILVKKGQNWLTGDMKNGQLCLNVALNDEECFNEFTDILYNNYVKVEPKQKIFMLGINDHYYKCQCEECKKAYHKYKESGVMMRFCNKVADNILDRLIADGHGDREFYICMFAYLYTLEPPVKTDEKGKVIPIDDSVIANDNVMVRIAPISSVNMYPHDDMEHNPSAAVAFKNWKVVAKNFAIWDYGTNFHCYLAPYPDWGTLQHNFLLYKDLGVSDILTQTPAHTSGTGFYAMTIYLRSELMWNVHQDFNELVDKFMRNYYKGAANEIKEYFDYLRTKYAQMQAKGEYDGNIYGKYLYTCWKDTELKQMEKIFDKAFMAIEPLKTSNPDEYNIVYRRLKTESLFYRYVQIDKFGSSYSDILERINDFENDAALGNLTGVGREMNNNPTSNDTMENVIASWINNYL